LQALQRSEGADLKARLRYGATPGEWQSPFWSAYAFDVRPGVAVDPAIHEFYGSMNTIGENVRLNGTTASGMNGRDAQPRRLSLGATTAIRSLRVEV